MWVLHYMDDEYEYPSKFYDYKEDAEMEADELQAKGYETEILEV